MGRYTRRYKEIKKKKVTWLPIKQRFICLVYYSGYTRVDQNHIVSLLCYIYLSQWKSNFINVTVECLRKTVKFVYVTWFDMFCLYKVIRLLIQLNVALVRENMYPVPSLLLLFINVELSWEDQTVKERSHGGHFLVIFFLNSFTFLELKRKSNIKRR